MVIIIILLQFHVANHILLYLSITEKKPKPENIKPISLSLPVALAMLTTLLVPACNTEAPERTVEIQVDSTYFTMNPMDIPFDTAEMKMINKALGEYLETYRTYREAPLPNSVMPALQFNPWPALFRAARFMPAVEYIQANRIRTLLIEEYNALLKDFDMIVTPSFGGTQLPATNMTGHPVAVVPNGEIENGSRTTISFLGNLFDEATILAVAKAYQDATDFDERRPPLFSGAEIIQRYAFAASPGTLSACGFRLRTQNRQKNYRTDRL